MFVRNSADGYVNLDQCTGVAFRTSDSDGLLVASLFVLAKALPVEARGTYAEAIRDLVNAQATHQPPGVPVAGAKKKDGPKKKAKPVQDEDADDDQE